MTRYELQCKKCGQVLGHMTYPGSSKDIEIINSTSIYGEYSEILCPACEIKRLSGDKRSMGATEEDVRQDDITDNALTVEQNWRFYYDHGYKQAERDLKRPQGEWILIDDTEKFIVKCSVCGRTEDSRMVKYYPFCHCGARMKGQQRMTDSQCVDYLENICKMFVYGSKNCEGQALEYQQKYISAIRYAIAKLQSQEVKE